MKQATCCTKARLQSLSLSRKSTWAPSLLLAQGVPFERAKLMRRWKRLKIYSLTKPLARSSGHIVECPSCFAKLLLPDSLWEKRDMLRACPMKFCWIWPVLMAAKKSLQDKLLSANFLGVRLVEQIHGKLCHQSKGVEWLKSRTGAQGLRRQHWKDGAGATCRSVLSHTAAPLQVFFQQFIFHTYMQNIHSYIYIYIFFKYKYVNIYIYVYVYVDAHTQIIPDFRSV